MTSTTIDSPAALLADLTRSGIKLVASGDKLRYRPRDRMTPGLIDRLRVHKQEILALMRCGASGGDAPAASTDAPASAAQQPPTLVDQVMAIFTDATVVDRRPVTGMQPDGHYIAENKNRQPVIDLLQAVHKRDPDHALMLRDAWRERVAICTNDGGLVIEEAEAVALDEIESKANAFIEVKRR